jgi:hypothetical protein
MFDSASRDHFVAGVESASRRRRGSGKGKSVKTHEHAAVVWADGQAFSTGRAGSPFDHLRAKEVLIFAPPRATPNPFLQALSESVVAIESGERASRCVAKDRACPRVPANPKTYPSGTREASKSRLGRQQHMPICRAFIQALWRTRTADPLLTMEVQGRYWRARPGTRGHVFPANRAFEMCLPCPRMPARAQPDVPVSYPRSVVCFLNE